MILMLDSQAPDAQREQAASDAKAKLEAKGEILHEANWGIRKMAYEIDRRATSDYRFYRFNGDKDLLDDLDHSLKIVDTVLRFRIFGSDPDALTAEPPDSEQIMRRDDDDRERGGRREGRGGPRRPRRDENSGEGSDRAPAASPPASEPASTPASAPASTPASEPASPPASEPASTPASPPASADD